MNFNNNKATPKKETSTTGFITNDYDDGDIPIIDLPQNKDSAEPLPESTRPRKDGPGGN